MHIRAGMQLCGAELASFFGAWPRAAHFFYLGDDENG